MPSVKWTTRSLKKYIALGERELLKFPKLSPEWLAIYSQLEWLREELNR